MVKIISSVILFAVLLLIAWSFRKHLFFDQETPSVTDMASDAVKATALPASEREQVDLSLVVHTQPLSIDAQLNTNNEPFVTEFQCFRTQPNVPQLSSGQLLSPEEFDAQVAAIKAISASGLFSKVDPRTFNSTAFQAPTMPSFEAVQPSQTSAEFQFNKNHAKP